MIGDDPICELSSNTKLASWNLLFVGKPTPPLILSFSKATLIAKEKRLSLCWNVDCCGTFYHMLSQVVHSLDNSHIWFGNRLTGSSIVNYNMKQIWSIISSSSKYCFPELYVMLRLGWWWWLQTCHQLQEMWCFHGVASSYLINPGFSVGMYVGIYVFVCLSQPISNWFLLHSLFSLSIWDAYFGARGKARAYCML